MLYFIALFITYHMTDVYADTNMQKNDN